VKCLESVILQIFSHQDPMMRTDVAKITFGTNFQSEKGMFDGNKGESIFL
jgi:hypothetical protein